MRTYVVWIPAIDRDEGGNVPAASKHVGVSPQYFDGEKLVGMGLAKVAGLQEPVWDAFFFYPPGARWTPDGLPPSAVAIAQVGGIVAGPPGTLPAAADQSKLPAELRGKLVVIGEQADFPTLLERVAKPFAAKYPR